MDMTMLEQKDKCIKMFSVFGTIFLNLFHASFGGILPMHGE